MNLRKFGPILLLSVAAATCVHAQDARGSIVGTVTDPTGGAIPNAPVEVLNKAMGTKINLATNSAGLYNATFLIPGAYRVTVELAGFKKSVRDDLEVRVNDRVQVDMQLQLGNTEQSVTVSGETPLLNTETASLGTVVDGRRVTDLPIPHGNPYFLIGLSAGVSFTRDPRLDRPFEPTHIVGYTMDGTRANRSDITIDGAVATATANNGEVIASYVPPADIVAEFKVQTATFDASFGQTEGGVTNISLKSGTNNLHGTLYYSNQTPGLFANDFFGNANNIARPDFFYHRWGASTGGPVYIPKVYDGRNKTFFMWGYEGILEARPRNNGTPTVPSAAMKAGDFSGLPSNFVIYNPFTRRPDTTAGRFRVDPFPGNKIPSNLFNPISKKVLDTYYPNPLQPGNADGTNNFLRPELQETADYYTHSVRIDHNLSDKHRMFGRASWYDRVSDYNNYFDNLSQGNAFQFASRAGTFDHVYTMNSTTVLNFRYGYNRFIRVTDANPEQVGFDLTSLGFPASFANHVSQDVRRFPRFDITGYQGTAQGGEYRPNDTHSLNGTLQKTMGSHNWKTGVEFRSYRETDTFFGNNQTGQFNFDSTWTRGPLDNSAAAPGQLGQSMAAFLLGLPSSGTVVRAASYAEQSTAWSVFFHDDWRVNNRLTLNIGLRYELETPLTERFNRSVRGFDTSFVQPGDAAARAAYALNPTPEVPVAAFDLRGGLTFAGVNGPRGLYETPKNLWMPRFGWAYKIDQKTVFRGGYGMFYGFLGQRRSDVLQSGFSRNTNLVPSLDNGLTFNETLSNPFKDGILEPVGAAQGAQTFVGQNITYFNEKPLAPQMQRWQGGIQREIGKGYVLDVTYVGNRGTHIEITQNLNVTPQEYLSGSLTRDNATINYVTANLPNPLRGLLPAGAIATFNNASIARERLLRPYPHFDQVNQSRFDGYSWYHSGRIGVEKRFSQGYTFSINYTLSKFMQATETYQSDDARPVEVISDADRPHRVASSGIWELPFGKGKMILGNAPKGLNYVIGGWQLGGVYTFQSGAPINFGNLAFNGSFANIALPSDQQRVERWFNVDAGFEKAAALQLANNRRYFPLRFGHVRADTINNFDFSLIKNTMIRESMNLQIKGEFLNGFNHPLFPAPNTTPTVAAFGTVVASNQANYPRRIQLSAKFIF